MITIENNFCDEIYLEKINNFIEENQNNFIDSSDDEYKNVFNDSKNINNKFLNYLEIKSHLNFLKTKYPILDKINLEEKEIKCVINKLIPGAKLLAHHDASLYTHLLYLNNDFEGGELQFLSDKIPNQTKRKVILTISPVKNLSVFTSENYYHKVLPVLSGERYTLTTFIRNKHNYNSNSTNNIL